MKRIRNTATDNKQSINKDRHIALLRYLEVPCSNTRCLPSLPHPLHTPHRTFPLFESLKYQVFSNITFRIFMYFLIRNKCLKIYDIYICILLAFLLLCICVTITKIIFFNKLCRVVPDIRPDIRYPVKPYIRLNYNRIFGGRISGQISIRYNPKI